MAINWTDEQWDAYEAETVTIPVTLLDNLILGANIVAKRMRLSRAQSKNWDAVVDKAQQYAKEVEEKINK